MTRAIPSSGKVRALIRSKWRTLLKGASTEADVLLLVRSFARTWSAEEIAEIPRDVWPSHSITPRDVTVGVARLAVAHADHDGSERGLALLQELLLFMTQAAVRMKHLGRVAATRGAIDRQVATEPEEGIGGAVRARASDAQLSDRDE